MAQITINPDYNYFDILVAVGVEPVHQTHLYTYSDGVLTVEGVVQEELDLALQNYDHQAYLDSIKPRLTDVDYLIELDYRLSMIELGL